MNATMNSSNLALAIALIGGATPSLGAPTAAAFKQEVRSGIEEIYIFRTTRARRSIGATAACAKAPFAAATEDFYDLWSILLRDADARISDSHRKAIGGFTACFGQAAPGQALKMYASGKVGVLTWVGLGECNLVKSAPPERTVVPFNCVLELNELPAQYAGGFAVSSTLATSLGKDADPTAHVPGYLSTSVVTIRVWSKAKETARTKSSLGS